MPREMFEDLAQDGLPDDFEPEGGVDFDADEATEPERDLEALTETLTNVDQGDIVRVVAGPAEAPREDTWKVLLTEENAAGFENRVTFVMKPQDDGWTRMYIAARGDAKDDFDDWELVSAPYHLPSKTANMADFAGNGWLIEAEVLDDV